MLKIKQLINEVKRQPSLLTEYYILLWLMAFEEVDAEQNIKTINKLLDVAIQHNLPFHRLIFLFNHVQNLATRLHALELALDFSAFYIDLAKQMNNEVELYFGMILHAKLQGVNGNTQQAIDLYEAAKEKEAGIPPVWRAASYANEARYYYRLGKKRQADSLINQAMSLAETERTIMQEEFMAPLLYQKISDGKVSESIELIESYVVRLRQDKVREEKAIFASLRESLLMLELEQLRAERHLKRFQLMSAALAVFAVFIVYLLVRQRHVSIELKNTSQKLLHINKHDGLTMLFNRSHWQENLNQSFHRLSRSNNPLTCLLMLDIDHFKLINDEYGHTVGDKVIVDVAKIIKSSLRTGDVAGRYGGEEFAVILENTSIENALKFAERLRKKIENNVVTHEGMKLHSTISIGCAQFSHEFQNEIAWIADADKALYLSKRNGRNQVTTL